MHEKGAEAYLVVHRIDRSVSLPNYNLSLRKIAVRGARGLCSLPFGHEGCQLARSAKAHQACQIESLACCYFVGDWCVVGVKWYVADRVTELSPMLGV